MKTCDAVSLPLRVILPGLQFAKDVKCIFIHHIVHSLFHECVCDIVMLNVLDRLRVH